MGLPDQDEEGGLEGVIGVVGVVQDTAADALDHAAVPLDEGGEGGFVAVAGEASQQLAVGHVVVGPQARQLAEGSQDPALLCRSHGLGPQERSRIFSIVRGSRKRNPLSRKNSGAAAPAPELHTWVRTDSTSLRFFRHYIVEVLMRRTDRTSFTSLTVWSPFSALLTAVAQLQRVRVTSVGNRQRPHHGGSHERRIHGTSTCHYSPPRRPLGQGHLPGTGPHRGLVAQMVAPLSRTGQRGTVRPDARTARRPAHPARRGADHPRYPPPAPGPCRAGHPLPPDR